MRKVEELERLMREYGDALAAYREVLATLERQMIAGKPSRERFSASWMRTHGWTPRAAHTLTLK